MAEITQRGDNNSLSFSQQTYYEGSRLSVSQDGVSNQAEIAQGDGNRLALVQDGNYNDADIRQGDYHNELNFTQSGDDNRLTVDQNGYGGVISGSSSTATATAWTSISVLLRTVHR